MKIKILLALFLLLPLAATSVSAQCFKCSEAPLGTIWCDDFEDNIPLDQKYFEYNSNNGDFIVKDSVGRNGSKGMRVLWQKGESSAGSLNKTFGKTPSNYLKKNSVNPDSTYSEIYWRMDVKHQVGWQGGGPDKLCRALTMANANWATGSMAHLWSGGSGGKFLGMDPASGIATNGTLKSTKYNDFDNLRWLGFKSGNIEMFSSTNSGKWFCVEGHVKLNTPGVSDGIFEFWINDTLQANSNNLNWHSTWNSDPNNMKINAIFFENYWNNGSPIEQERYFDNLVISTKRINCNCASTTQLQSLPELPNTKDVVTCFPDSSGYKTITVGANGKDFTDLQQAINAADLGTIIKIDAGATFNGGFTLPKKTKGNGWIILMSSRMDLLPKDETRINPSAATGNPNFPTQADAMPKIITNNLSGIPCFVTQANANHYRLVGLEVTADKKVINSYGLINLGDGSSAQNSVSLMPDHFVIDRCYIHGHTEATIMKYGVALNCANAAVVDSYISDFHSIGFDTQAISGINGSGPFKILNNYLEAAGENIMFGGAAAAIPGLVPSDIEVRQNYFYKPLSWRVGDPSYAGKHWTIKNLFELKTGKRVLLDGNILENSWADLPIGQSGYGILLTIRTEGGGSPQAEVSDITISNNIVRNVGAGITLSGRDDNSTGNRSKRINILNNLFENIDGAKYGDLNVNGPNDGTFIKIGEPEDLVINHNTIFQTGPITWAGKVMTGFSYTNNISNSKAQSAGYQGIYGPGFQHGNKTIANYFPDVTDANQRINKNVLIAGDASKYTNYNTISKNYFPAAAINVGFKDFAKGAIDYRNYALTSSSPYYKDATDGKDLGVDFAMLDSAMKVSRGCVINPVINVTSINLNKQLDSLFIGDSLQLTATVLPSNATNKNVMWNSTNSQVLSVSNTGKAKAIALGNAMIIAKTIDGNFADTCSIIVKETTFIESEIVTDKMVFSPNPVNNVLNIDLPSNEYFEIEISTMLGVNILNSNNAETINVADITRGTYILKIKQGKTVYMNLFVKE